MKKITTIDEYIEALPPESKEKVETICAIVKKMYPEAEEKISWGVPMYYLKSPVMGLGAAQKHVAIYGLNATFFAKHKKEFGKYDISKGTIRFPLDEKLPITLIKKIIKLMFAQKKTWLVEKKAGKTKATAKAKK